MYDQFIIAALSVELETMKTLFAFSFLVALNLALVNIVECRPVREINACISSYLKSNGYQIDELSTGKELNPLCSVIVEVTKNQILSSFKKDIDQNDEEVDSQCIVNSLDEQGFANQALVLVILDDLNIEDEKKHQLKVSTQKIISDYVFNSFLTCDGGRKFSEDFEKLFNEDDDSSEKDDPQEDYCTRHHIMKNSLIKVKGVSLIENPNKLDTTSIDCKKIYKKVLKQAEDELVEHITGKSSNELQHGDNDLNEVYINNECILKVIRNENFIDKMIPFDYAKEFSLTSAQRQQLKEQFVHTMKLLSLRSRKCID